MTAPAYVLPAYGGRSLEQLLPSVRARLGGPGTDTLGLPDAPRWVVVLVDGLGHDLLADHADLAPYLGGLLAAGGAPMTCGVPSTTATSLTSLGTGLPPGGHGVTGYTSRIPGTTRFLNSLTWSDGVDPEQWQPHPTVLAGLAADGVPTAVVNAAEFERSGLTRCSQRGVPFHGVRSSWERLDVVVELVEETPRSLVYAYESRIDHTGHGEGVDSPEWRDALRSVDDELRELRAELPSDTALVVTADHGMIDLPADDRLDVDDVPGLLDDVDVLAGEARLRHVHAAPGTAEAVAGRWRAACGDRALVRTRDEAVAEGWFGPLEPRVVERVGDVVVAALGDFAVFARRHWYHEASMRGFHGSLTPREMRVPLLVDL